MTIDYQFGDVDAHGALIRARAASLGVERQSSVGDVLAAADFWDGAGSTAWKEFMARPGRNFGATYEQTQCPHEQKIQTADSNMANADSAAGSRWA
jgi:hypothetical protein